MCKPRMLQVMQSGGQGGMTSGAGAGVCRDEVDRYCSVSNESSELRMRKSRM